MKNMDENNKNDISSDNKESGPLQARVDALYLDLFEKELKKHPGMKKKNLMENMIYGYVRNREKSEQEKILSFSSEISLIATDLDNILRVFKNIAAKSQDTISSQKSYFEQSIKNITEQLDTAKLNINNLTEKNSLLEEANNGFKLEKDNLLKTIDSLKDSAEKKTAEVKELKIKSNDLLEEIRALKKVEKENVQLANELSKSVETVKKLEGNLSDKDSEIHKLSVKISELEETLSQIKNKHADEMKVSENKFLEELNNANKRIRKELELDKKSEQIDLQMKYNELLIKYNDLQIEHMKSLKDTTPEEQAQK